METFDLVFISSSQTCLLHWLSIRGPAAVKKRIIKVNEESVISVSVWVTTTLLINNQLTLTAEDTHSSSANIKGKVLSNNAALLFHRIEADKNTHTHPHLFFETGWCSNWMHSVEDWTPAWTTHTLCSAITSTVLIYLPLPAVRNLQDLCKTLSRAWQTK